MWRAWPPISSPEYVFVKLHVLLESSRWPRCYFVGSNYRQGRRTSFLYFSNSHSKPQTSFLDYTGHCQNFKVRIFIFGAFHHLGVLLDGPSFSTQVLSWSVVCGLFLSPRVAHDVPVITTLLACVLSAQQSSFIISPGTNDAWDQCLGMWMKTETPLLNVDNFFFLTGDLGF